MNSQWSFGRVVADPEVPFVGLLHDRPVKPKMKIMAALLVRDGWQETDAHERYLQRREENDERGSRP